MSVPTIIKETSSLSSKICRAAFCVYIIYMLLGAGMPFQDTDPKDERASSNPINQVVDSVIPLVCLVCLWPEREKALEILKREKYLVLFLAWCALSIMWSDAPFSSIKACVRMIGSSIVALAFLVNAKSPDDTLKYIKIALAIYIPLTFLAIALVPEATQWEWPAWRGLASHKNTLGEIALISTIVWASGISRDSMKRSLWCSLFAAASLALVLGSKSITCFMTLCFIAFIALCFHVARRFGPALCTAATGSCCAIGLLIVFNAGGVGEIFGDLGRDTTFTGRTDVWDLIIDEAKAHPLLGSGFAGFWTPENDVRIDSGETSEWHPTEGHEGYLDLWNETGVVGLGLLALMIIFYFRHVVNLETDSHLWHWLFISVLIVNTMESTLFRAGSFTGWIFVLSYLTLCASRLRREQDVPLPAQPLPTARAA